MPTKNVSLTERQSAYVDGLVAEGRYMTASEVFRDGLALIEQRDAEYHARLDAMRAAAEVGWADIEAGRFHDVSLDEIPGFIADLSRRASARLSATPSVHGVPSAA